MNAVIENILHRRSVRFYDSRPVDAEHLKTLLDCALYAPTGHNSQNTRFLVIRNAETLNELNLLIKKELSSREPVEGSVMKSAILRARTPEYHFIHHAPLLISAAAPRSGENSMAECAAAVENILLAAASLGLGACWSNQPHWLSAVPEIRAVFKKIGLKDDEEIFASAAVGWPAGKTPQAAPRRSGRISLDEPL